MKLNPDIIFDHLNKRVEVTYYGHGNTELCLCRPEFYQGGNIFLSNHLYLADADSLPRNPMLHKDAMLICVGGMPPEAFFSENCVCFLIKDEIKLPALSNIVHNIFDKYDEWFSKLQKAILKSATIQEVIDLAFTGFENPMVFVDINFNILAYSTEIDTSEDLYVLRNLADHRGKIPADEMDNFIRTGQIQQNLTEPFRFRYRGIPGWAVNIFENGQYIGNISLFFALKKEHRGDLALLQFFSKYLKYLLKNHPTVVSPRKSLRSLLFNLLDSSSGQSTVYPYIELEGFRSEYLCLKIIPTDNTREMPLKYISHSLEELFLHSIAFPYASAVVLLVDLNKLPVSETEFFDSLAAFLKKVDYLAGVSTGFSDLSMVRLYYRQAAIVLDQADGNVRRNIFRFEDYLLQYLVCHSTGEFPFELLLSEGMRRLFEYNKSSKVDYIQTLSVYLNQNMSITKTANELYLHKSSLMDRLERIEGLLQADLKDPDVRLYVMLILKILKLKQADQYVLQKDAGK